MYFDSMPVIYYPFYNGQTGRYEPLAVTDITINVRPTKDMIQAMGSYLPYTIRDGDTPWSVSDRLYGSPDYDWLIMIANNYVDYAYDWPLTNAQVYTYVTQKYGSGNQYSTHHYVDSTGQYVVDSTVAGATPVTNYSYEQGANDAKRQIVLVDPLYLPSIKAQLATLTNGS